MKYVIIYVWVAVVFNMCCDGLTLVRDLIPERFESNTIFYNLHSTSRFACFTLFFLNLNLPYYRLIQKMLVIVFGLFFIFYFSFIDSFFNTNYISSDLMTVESFLLLYFCMIYYLSVLRGENPKFRYRKDFWVVTGLSIFAVINFFIFLFYNPLIFENPELAINIWNFHNIAFITFILFLTRAIYVPDTD